MNKPSVCPLDCPDTCSLSVAVEGNRITAVRGSRANPFTAGAICRKVSRLYPEFVHGSNRLRTPLRRCGPKGSGQFERIDWDSALALIHTRVSAIMERHGAQSVVPLNYAGPHGMLAGDSMSLRFFHRLGASRLARSPLCGGVRGEAYHATFGAVPGMPPQQVAQSKLIVVWGNNVSVCNLHLLRHINSARRQGARLVVIDPRRIRVAEQADLHLALRPGTDVVLAWGLATELERIGGLDLDFIGHHVLGFDRYMEQARRYPPAKAAALCGVAADDIRTLARWYRDATPAAVAWGNGLERNQNGGSAIRAICALPALAGKFGVSGGGLVAAAGDAFPKTPQHLTRPDLAPAATRTLNIMDVPRLVLDETVAPPVKALFIYNHNPLIVHPDQNRMRQALAREDLFTVGIEVAMTDSMAYADVILPACTHFEHADVFAAYGQQFLQRAEPVIPPVGESLPNTEIFRRLAVRFGFTDAAFRDNDQALIDAAVDGGDPRLRGLLPHALPTDRALPMQFDGGDAVLYRNVLPQTASGKIELLSEQLGQLRGCPLPDYRPVRSDYPLALLSPASDQRISSTFGGLPASDDAPVLDMHPLDALARGLSDDTPVRVWNDLGEVHLRLHLTERVRPGVVSSEKGAWLRTSANGQTISALAPSHKADLAEGACFNDARVDVAALAD